MKTEEATDDWIVLWPRLKLVALRWSLSAEQFVGSEQAVRLTTDFSKPT